MSSEKANAVELIGVSRRYGRNYILKDINLTVTEGRVVVLCGGNGAGKTTLLRVLATTLRPSRGRGSVFGFDLVKEGQEVRRRLAYLGVLGGSYGGLTALENLRLAATLYGQGGYGQGDYSQNGAGLEALLERVGLLSARDKPARAFSSGMKKRLALARVLLCDATLLLLDEPHASLDEEGQRLVDEVIQEAKAAGKTVVMASHDLGRVATLADSVLRLERGRLALAAPSQAVSYA